MTNKKPWQSRHLRDDVRSQVLIKIPEKLKAKLDYYTVKNKLSKNELITHLITLWCDREEAEDV